MFNRIVSMPGARRPLPLRRSSFRFAGQPESVKESRDWLNQHLSLTNAPEETTNTTLLLLSELATNNVKHAPTGSEELGDFYVRLFIFHNRLRVEVQDAHGRGPTLRVLTPDNTAEGGRGLLLVNALASRWGRFRSPMGSGMFFELRWQVPQHLAPAVPLQRKGR